MPKQSMIALWAEYPDRFPPLAPELMARVPRLRHPFVIPVSLVARAGGSGIEKRRIVTLWTMQNGRCFWCERETLLPGDVGYNRPKTEGALSGKAATVDHIYSKLSPHRYKNNGSRLIVMACFTCNNKRSKEECLLVHRLRKQRQRPGPVRYSGELIRPLW